VYCVEGAVGMQTAVKGKVIVMVIFAPEYEGGMTEACWLLAKRYTVF
jgi:hypothetical protein